MWYKIRHDKGVRIIALIILLCIAFSAGQMCINYYAMPEDAEQIIFAAVLTGQSALHWNYTLTEQNQAQFIDKWNEMDWELEILHHGNRYYWMTQDLLYEMKLIYNAPHPYKQLDLWIYFCKDNCIRIAYSNGTALMYNETSGKYQELITFFEDFAYYIKTDNGKVWYSEVNKN